MQGIYKITNPKGKIYIGQSVNIEKRFSSYKSIRNCHYQIKLFNSLKKYGFGMTKLNPLKYMEAVYFDLKV